MSDPPLFGAGKENSNKDGLSVEEFALLLGADGTVGVPTFILTVAAVTPADEYVTV